MFDLYSSNVTSRENKTTYESQKTRGSPDILEDPPSARGKELQDEAVLIQRPETIPSEGPGGPLPSQRMLGTPTSSNRHRNLHVSSGKPLLVTFERDNLAKRKEARLMRTGIEDCMPWTDRTRFKERYAMIKKVLASDRKYGYESVYDRKEKS
jgi:hypothetical protein